MREELTVALDHAPCDSQTLYALLTDAARRYTRGESDSIPLEIGRELLKGVCYLLAAGAGEGLDGFEARARGLRITEEKTKRAQRWCDFLRAGTDDWGSGPLRETLSGLPAFFKQYNPELFAHEIPGDIDYPLFVPVEDARLGVDWVLSYELHLYEEARFLRKFPRANVEALLEIWTSDYRDLTVNLFEPVFIRALSRALAGLETGLSPLEPARREALLESLYARTEADVSGRLERAARKLCGELGYEAPPAYLLTCARALSARARFAAF